MNWQRGRVVAFSAVGRGRLWCGVIDALSHHLYTTASPRSFSKKIGSDHDVDISMFAVARLEDVFNEHLSS